MATCFYGDTLYQANWDVTPRHLSFIFKQYLKLYNSSWPPESDRVEETFLSPAIMNNDTLSVCLYNQGYENMPHVKYLDMEDVPTEQLLLFHTKAVTKARDERCNVFAVVDEKSKSENKFALVDKTGKFTNPGDVIEVIASELSELVSHTEGDPITVENSPKNITFHKDSCKSEKYIPAFMCSEWPEMNKLKARPRPAGWPHIESLDEILQLGCYVIPSKDPKENKAWEYSFVEAEDRLMNTMNTTQLECYQMLKILHQLELQPPKILTDEHLKAALFAACEHIDEEDWNIDTLAKCINYILDVLLHALIVGNLPHYFRPGVNLFADISEDFMFDLTTKISEIRRDPLKFLFRLNPLTRTHKMKPSPNDSLLCPTIEVKLDEEDNQENQGTSQPQQPAEAEETSQPRDITMLDLFQDVVKDARLFNDEEKQILIVFKNCYERLIIVCINQEWYNEALELGQEFLERLPPDTIAKWPYLCNLALLGVEDLNKIILFLELLVEQSNGEEFVLLQNLGCMYHSLMHTVENSDDRQEIQAKTDDLFKQAMQINDQSPALYADYGNYLVSTHQYENAVLILDRAVELRKIDPLHQNGYGKLEINCVDQNIVEEIKIFGEVSVNSSAYACYLLTICQIQLENDIGLAKAMQEFEDICSDLEESFSYKLLGYAYRHAESFSDAAAAFQRALQLEDDLTSKQHIQSLIDSLSNVSER